MDERPLITAVKASNREEVLSLLSSGHNVQERGEQDWPALNFAAGKGDLEMLRLLSDRGADLFATGTDRRTPYQIAVAASHFELARELARREAEAGGDRERISSREWEIRPYCKAYRLDEVRRYPQWNEGVAGAPAHPASSDDDLVFIHEDYSVTRSIWRDKDILLKGDAADWRLFCESTLGFRVPSDIDDLAQDDPSL